MDGCYNIVRKRIDVQKEKQIGETFGNFDALKEDDEYGAFRLNQRGYLLQFEQVNEVKFLTNNNIFQKIMQK